MGIVDGSSCRGLDGPEYEVRGKPSTKDLMHSLQRTVVMRLAGFIISVVVNMEWIR